MRPFKIGVMSDSFRVAPREGIRMAGKLGADGIQLYTVHGEMAPERLDRATRAEFKSFCRGLGLEFAALCGDLGGHGFELADENPHKIERTKRILDLASDLGARVVTTHIGVVPPDAASRKYGLMRAALKELGDYAASKGATLAIETGPEPARRLKGFLDAVGSRGLGVNLDPGNLVMVTAEDPVAAVRILGEYIVHTHAKDGVQHRPCDPVQVYNAFAEGGVEGFDFGKYFGETPLGEGSVPWDAYLDALTAAGYKGFLTIERETGRNPAADIREAVAFLRKKIG
ncbi:MAG: sugar phosphate isomerase/epimerase family protein [Planctomycetota bacterium]